MFFMLTMFVSVHDIIHLRNVLFCDWSTSEALEDCGAYSIVVVHDGVEGGHALRLHGQIRASTSILETRAPEDIPAGEGCT